MKGDSKGGMPFATIAVTILLMSTVLMAITAGYDSSESDVKDLSDQMGSMERAEASMRRHIESGLGNILLAISRDPSLGPLDERHSAFESQLSEWMEFNMPLYDRGIRGDLSGYDVDLMTKSLGNDQDETGCRPTFLYATGTVDLTLRGDNVHGSVKIAVESDGTYGLPLVSSRTSMFESMVNGISLHDMISYQLTSLAEYRVMNGYGSTSRYGESGTSSIITSEDVLLAYRNSIDAISLLCFRHNGNDLGNMERVDLSDVLVSGYGDVTIDLSLLYAQSLMSSIDDISLGWFEYLCGNKVLDSLGPDTSSTRRLADMVLSFLKGEDVHGAGSYIESVMASNGYSLSDYDRPGSGTTTMSYGGYTVTVENPTSSLMAQPWIEHFKSGYYRDRDYLMDFIRGVVRDAAMIASEDKGLGTISVYLDPDDPESFSEAVCESVVSTYESSRGMLNLWMYEALSCTSVNDPFYGAISETISSHSQDFVLGGMLMESLMDSLTACSGNTLDPRGILDSTEMMHALHEYRKKVMDDLAVFEILRDVPGGQPGMIRNIVSLALSDKMAFLDILLPMERKIETLCHDIGCNISMNPSSGTMDLPIDRAFGITQDGGRTYEKLDVVLNSDPVSSSPVIMDEECTHTIILDGSMAPYTTAFRVALYDILSYDVKGYSNISDVFGTYTSHVVGKEPISLELQINVVSGWPLAGVDYIASTTIIDDLTESFLELIEPLIEPIRDVLGLMYDIVSLLSDRMMEIVNQVSKTLVEAYNRLMEPMERLNEWITSHIEEFIIDSALSILFSINLSKQYIEFTIYGYSVRISTSAMTWVNDTKTLLSVDVSGPIGDYDVSMGITMKSKGEVIKDNVAITCKGSVKGDNWNVNVHVDPLMKLSKHLLTIDGECEDKEVSIILPELVKYNETGISLSDVPAIGDQLSRIPVPGLGVNIGLDAGFSIRLSNPMKDGLIINEFESNPPGQDRGSECIELLNNSAFTIDLNGYTISACSDRKNKTMVLSGTIAPGEYMVLKPTFLLVNQSGKYTKNGEAIVVKDTEGNEVDKTPTMKDESNDGKTIQRKYDGSTEWVLSDGTMGYSNGSAWTEGLLTPEDVKDIVWYGVEKGFEEVEAITDLKSLAEFIRSLVHNTIDRTIDHICGMIQEVSVYISVEVSDMTSTASGGIRLALRTDSDFGSDLLKLIAGKVEALVLGIKDPYGIDPYRVIPEDVDLEICVGARVGFPRVLTTYDDVPEIRGEVVFRSNIASLTRIIGENSGSPQLDCGIRFVDVPAEIIPSIMKPNKNMSQDLWLFRISLIWA